MKLTANMLSLIFKSKYQTLVVIDKLTYKKVKILLLTKST